MDYAGKKVAILGFDTEGRASYQFFKQRGADLTIHDQNPELETPEGVKTVLGEGYLDDLEQYDLLVRTPGLLPYKIATDTQVTTHMNEFLKHCPALTVGITGSKGKGTTSTLIYEILSQIRHSELVSESHGQEIFLGGNIGQPPLEFLDEIKEDDIVVLEMSNLQLWDIHYSPDVAVLLKIVEEHMDWHRGNMEEYVNTKRQITAHQSEQDVLVYFGENKHTQEIAAGSPAGLKIPYFIHEDTNHLRPAVPSVASGEGRERSDSGVEGSELGGGNIAIWLDGEDIKVGDQVVCKTNDVQLPGRHNLQNVCAAIGGALAALARIETVESSERVASGEISKKLPSLTSGQARRVEEPEDSISLPPERSDSGVEGFGGLLAEKILKLVQNGDLLTAIRKTIRNFGGLPHRLQEIGEVDGVKYIDDSIGTTPDTAVAAINSFPQPKIMILGGSSKGHEFGELAQKVVESNVKHVITLGTTAPEIEQALTKAGFLADKITSFVDLLNSFQHLSLGADKLDKETLEQVQGDQELQSKIMPKVVQNAHQVAKPGDVVLLSPACASFGLFENYKDRARQFCSAVQQLSL